MNWHDRAKQLYELYKNSKTPIAEITKIIQAEYFPNDDYQAVKDRVKKFIKRHCRDERQEDNSRYNVTVEYREDGSVIYDRLIEIYDDLELSPDDLTKYHGLDATKWKIVNYKNNYWHSQVKGGTRLLMCQSKIVVKPLADDEISFVQIKEWFSKFEPKQLTYINRVADYGAGGHCHILPIADLHYNLLATGFITGNEYNCKIAKDRFLSVIEDNINRICGKGISKIIFPVGNDLFNANGINGTTFKGTQQTNEKHIFEAYCELFDVMVYAITRLNTIAPVDVVYIPSNHDKEITFYFIHNLFTQFKNESDITIDYSPKTNKYRKFGNVLFVFAHDAKIDDISSTALDEASEMLEGVKFINVFLSHTHAELVKQKRNITVRRLSTISGKSDWTVENGYGSNTVNQSFIFSNTYNITDILYTTVIA